ncbi:MAG TPA: Abi-alpha family protein [Bryobacteraceae bacterium]|jgi:hypothetical protein
MDPTDLIKAAPALAKGAEALAAAIPFTAIVKRMLGPAADELAEMWRDQVRLYRYERQLKCVQKAERMAQEAGFTPQAVPPKILFPLLEGASFEDNEDLHTMWAALLVNAAGPDGGSRVRPGFIATLRQLSPDEALLLSYIYDHAPEPATGQEFDQAVPASDLLEPYASAGFGEIKRRPDGILESIECDTWKFGTCLDSLVSEQVITRRDDLLPAHRSLAAYSLTFRGYEFVTACRPPKPRS